MKTICALFILTILNLSFAHAKPLPAATNIGGHFKKVVWMVFENTNYDAALKQADFAAAVKKGVLLTNLNAEIHPSQGNYIAMISGNYYGVNHDNAVDLNGPHLGDLLEKAGQDWRVYAEDYPGNCFTGMKSGQYVRKHNPFMSFTNVSTDAGRCQKIQSADNFDQDLASDSLPAYTMYIPNMKNDGHDTGVDYAGKYLTARFGKFMQMAQNSKDLLMVITFDESGRSSPTNQVFTLLIGGSIVPGSQNNQKIDHTALLKLVEDEMSLGNLQQHDAQAPVLSGFWK